MTNNILIIDDEDKLRSLLTRIISLENFNVFESDTYANALKKLKQKEIDVVICDVKLPDANGVELVKDIKQKYPLIEIILLTAYGNIPDGVQAIKNGAFDYLTKGDDNNKIIPLLFRAIEKVTLSKRIQQLEKQLGTQYSFDRIIGKSAIIQTAIQAAQKVASTDATVMLTGETGTGKEVFAQAIHNESNRKKYNFIAVNCSAFSKDLLENELFGHKMGAFTGANKETKGIFEEAHKGTVFLDEIGEMPLELQAKMLRVLETGEFLKVGDNKPTKIDVRIITATHRNLKKEVELGHFREDLFYRISTFQIELPPLRKRIEDIEDLVLFFLDLFAAKTNKKITKISKSYLQALQNSTWNGNIRELKNIIERSVILTDANCLEIDTLPSNFKDSDAINEKMLTLDLASAEKLHILKILDYTKGNKTEAARVLNIALTTLYRKLEEYKIN
ncbi:MAG: sigma-54 dependent transcriptional regulator [Sphingobacteriaceae bacterium]|nr:sigma-54 dependent transcriptional regulator [Sphingobacteriaceae bacterium]